MYIIIIILPPVTYVQPITSISNQLLNSKAMQINHT